MSKIHRSFTESTRSNNNYIYNIIRAENCLLVQLVLYKPSITLVSSGQPATCGHHGPHHRRASSFPEHWLKSLNIIDYTNSIIPNIKVKDRSALYEWRKE